MAISQRDADVALREVADAAQRVRTMLIYRNTANYCLLWGAIRLIANLVTEFVPALAQSTWYLLSALGVVLSVWLATQQRRSAQSENTQPSAWKYALRNAGAWLVISGFIIATLLLLPPSQPKQINAFICLFWAFLYALVGLWIGWRILTIGLLTACSVLFGFFFVTGHFSLYLALAVDSLLILGALWLRKV